MWNLSLVVHETAIHGLEIQIFSNIGVDKNANQGTISHHELWAHGIIIIILVAWKAKVVTKENSKKLLNGGSKMNSTVAIQCYPYGISSSEKRPSLILCK